MDAIILAAGEGTRMKSALPKPLHRLCGVYMVEWCMRAAIKASKCKKPVVVIGHGAHAVSEALGEKAVFALQSERLGSGHALMCAREHITPGGYVLVMAGDMPLLRAETLQALCDAAKGNAAAVLTATLSDPSRYGRIVRNADGDIQKIVEYRDASEEERGINEINSAVYCFAADDLLWALDLITNENDQGEYYLTDVIELLATAEKRVTGVIIDEQECLGVNNRLELSQAAQLLRARINAEHMLGGVTMIDPQATYIDAGVTIGRDTVIYPGCVIEGKSAIGEGCTLTGTTHIKDSVIGDGCTVKSCVITDSRLGSGVTIGPFSQLRPNSVLGDGCKVGNFVEVKNSNVAMGAKLPHLSYIGDGDVGENTNIGCGVIFSNYDGVKKHRTVIGDGVFVGCNTNLVPPVKVGDNAYIAAGSTITEDVPDGALAIARSRQINKQDWKTRRDRVYRKD